VLHFCLNVLNCGAWFNTLAAPRSVLEHSASCGWEAKAKEQKAERGCCDECRRSGCICHKTHDPLSFVSGWYILELGRHSYAHTHRAIIKRATLFCLRHYNNFNIQIASAAVVLERWRHSCLSLFRRRRPAPPARTTSARKNTHVLC
jgi:hypothetical protein